MTWHIELGLLALTAGLVGTYIHSTDPLAPVPTHRAEAFTQTDFDAFDRGFPHEDSTCEIGLEASKICLTPSPMEDRVIKGEALPASVPAMSANMRVLLALELKTQGLKTVQYGQTLALIEPKTRVVKDLLRLDAESFTEARRSGGGASMVTSAK